MKSVMFGAYGWMIALMVMEHVLLLEGVSFDAPPDIEAMLGPPPKPSWVKYDLYCDKTGISSASTHGVAYALPAGQIGGIVAGLCVLILLTLVAIYYLKKREKSMVPKYKVNPQKAADESNYLYNCSIRGKTWGEQAPENNYTVGNPDPFLTHTNEKEPPSYLGKGSGGSNASLDTGYNEGAPQGVYVSEEGGYPEDSLPHGGSMSTSSGISLSHSDLNNLGDEHSDPRAHFAPGLSAKQPDLIESTLKAKPAIHRRRQPQPGSLPVLGPIQPRERSRESSQEKTLERPDRPQQQRPHNRLHDRLQDRPLDRQPERPRRKPRHSPRYQEAGEGEEVAVASFPSPRRPGGGPRQARPPRPPAVDSLSSDQDSTLGRPNPGHKKRRRRKMPPGYPDRHTMEDSV